MLIIKFVDNKAVGLANYTEAYAFWIAARARRDSFGDGFETRTDWQTFEQADKIARELSEATGRVFLAVDSGPNVSPRYDVIEAPKIGDSVSRGFNGDYYPCGTVTHIGKDYRTITTSDLKRTYDSEDNEVLTPRKFWRKKLTGAWMEEGGGPFCLVSGHRDERNPSF